MERDCARSLRSQLHYRIDRQKVRGGWIAVCLLALLLVGCDRGGDSSESDAGRFGDPYQIVTSETPSAPDEPPALLDDSLSVMVGYPGGCKDHGFTLTSSVSGDSASIWLRHDADGDDCEAMVSDRLLFSVPDRVLSARHIYLHNPEGDIPFVLRWDMPASTQPAPAAE